ncbi:MAG: hypothetical protein M1318_06755 [Firmicutes bacterium]|nr:hypothetical protein [Bacillota bacterium]
MSVVCATLAATAPIRAVQPDFQIWIRKPVVEIILVALAGLIVWIARRLS